MKKSQNNKAKKFFTYVQNKKFGDYYIPARFQYTILRDYYKKIKQNFILPQGEPIFTKTGIRLRTIVDNLKINDGLVLLSIYMLPEDTNIRQVIYKKLLYKKIETHFIFENIIAKNLNDFKKINNFYKLNKFK